MEEVFRDLGLSNEEIDIYKASYDTFKSRDMYQKWTCAFLDHCNEHKLPKSAPKSVHHFLAEMSLKYAPPTLWVFYSIINKHFTVWERSRLVGGVHAMGCSRVLIESFSFPQTLGYTSLASYPAIKMFIKDKNKRWTATKADVFSREQVDELLKSIPNDCIEKLSLKAVFILGVFGCMRCKEIHGLQFENIEVKEDVIFVSVKGRKNGEWAGW